MTNFKLILDIDQTLMYRTKIPIENTIPDLVIDLDNDEKLYIYIRKNLDIFLQIMDITFNSEIYIYTASDEILAKKIFEKLDIDKYIKNYFGFTHCLIFNNNICKSIQYLKHYADFKNTDTLFIVDDLDVYIDLIYNSNCYIYYIKPFKGINILCDSEWCTIIQHIEEKLENLQKQKYNNFNLKISDI